MLSMRKPLLTDERENITRYWKGRMHIPCVGDNSTDLFSEVLFTVIQSSGGLSSALVQSHNPFVKLQSG